MRTRAANLLRPGGVAAAAFRGQAPAGAPNVVIVLLDDLGFGRRTPSGGRSKP